MFGLRSGQWEFAAAVLGTQGVTAAQLSCTTWRTAGLAGSEGCGPVVLGKTVLLWWGFQERWWDGVLAGKWQQGEGCCRWDRRDVLGELCCSSSCSVLLQKMSILHL